MRFALGVTITAWLIAVGHAEESDFLWQEALPTRQPTQAQLLDITRAGDSLIAVGAQGLIIRSGPNAQKWQQANVPVSLTLTAVTFVDAQHGWAVGHGGAILHTTDGGETWQLQFDGERANMQWLEHLQARRAKLEHQIETMADTGGGELHGNDLQYQLELIGFAIDDVKAALASGPTDPFLDVWFKDTNTGFAVGAYGLIFRTDNGGRDWLIAADTIDNPERYHYYAIARDAEGRLYLCGEAGLLYRSTDGGQRWQRLEGVYDGSLFGLVTSGESVLAFGLRGFVFRSRDGGKTWQTLTGGDAPTLYGGQLFPNGSIMLVGSGGAIAISHDGGDSFDQRQHPSRGTLSAVIDRNGVVYAVGMPGIKTLERTR